LDAGAGAIRDVMATQRARLSRLFGGLSPAQWTAPSRCDAWTVHDVARHIADVANIAVTQYRHEPSPFPSAGFDPRDSPVRWLRASANATPNDTIRAFERLGVDEAAAIEDRIERGDHDEIDGPYGLVAWPVFALHVLWDTWLHERDIVGPLRLPYDVPPLETRCVVLYGLLVAATPAAMAALPVETTVALDGEDGATFEIQYPDRVVVAVSDGQAGALHGDLLPTLDSLAGRDQAIEDVLHGDATALERLSWLRAFMIPDPQTR
jgi:uncharacterized protein (TIGR03083 family)